MEFIQDYLIDAKRRDFTINALYFDPIKKQLYDPVGGISNLKSRILKFVGDPKKRIDEDALRMLRGVRLATQLGFKLEKNSFAAIKTRAKYIQGISGERIKAELDKILLSKNRVSGLRLLQASGLLRFIAPEISALNKVSHKSKTYHLEGNVFEHTLLVLEALKKKNLPLMYSAIFHDSGKVSTGKKVLKNGQKVYSFKGHIEQSGLIFDKFAKRLKFSRLHKNLIDWLIKHHEERRKFFELSDAGKVRHAMHKNFPSLLDLWQADMHGNKISPANDFYRKPSFTAYLIGLKLHKKLALKFFLMEKLAKGDLIMKYSKLKPGRELGQKIQDVKVHIVLGRIKNEKDLKKYLGT